MKYFYLIFYIVLKSYHSYQNTWCFQLIVKIVLKVLNIKMQQALQIYFLLSVWWKYATKKYWSLLTERCNIKQ